VGRSTLRVFVNTVLGRPWKDGGDDLDEDARHKRSPCTSQTKVAGAADEGVVDRAAVQAVVIRARAADERARILPVPPVML
jgi:hypothetical protein